MKLKSILIFAPAIAFCMGCAQELTPDVELQDPNLIPLNISGSISQVHTKATAEGFVDKDALGLFAVNYSENNTVAGTLVTEGNQADNIKYVFDEPNQKWNPVKAVYYKDVNTNADLYVYYPFQSSINDINAANFEVKQDQSREATETELSGYEASDFLWGKTANVVPTESKVAISLTHRLSSVQVTLVEGTGFDEDEFAGLEKSLILTNTTRKATIDYATGTATPLGNPQLNGIVMCAQEDGSFRAIVIPQSVEAGSQLFAITIAGTSYSFSQSADVTYQAGKQMNVSISVNKKVLTGEYEFVLSDTQIVDWTEDRNTHGGEARQYFVVNVSEPGTLGSIIKSMGKNPDKIKNLKVSGNINRCDFDFMRDSMAIVEAINMKETIIVPSGDWIQGFHTSNPEYYSYLLLYGTPDYIDDNGYANWSDTKGGVIPKYAFRNKKTLTKFVFPEIVNYIGASSFENTNLSGALVLPEDLLAIHYSAFWSTNITSVEFGSKIQAIDYAVFLNCSSLSSELHFPASLIWIEGNAFAECALSGKFVLPENLEYIGEAAFRNAGSFSGGLKIPDKVTALHGQTFGGTSFTGTLDLNNVTLMGENEFGSCGFNGELQIPEGMIDIPSRAFAFNHFINIIFPSSLRTIGQEAFRYDSAIVEPLVFPEGLISIGASAFSNCPFIPSISLPSTLQIVQGGAFAGCYAISSIVSLAYEPPIIFSSTFDGVGKDNFTVEVPEQYVILYKTESGWSDFKRIAGHYDFSLSRRSLRCLNKGISRTYHMRVPSGLNWEVDPSTVPSWIEVTPSCGIGKTDVTISIKDMNRTNDSFYVQQTDNIGFQYESEYKGRSAELTFRLIEKGYQFNFSVEQYDYEYQDGNAITLQTATKGEGIDIIFIGEGYDARNIADGSFFSNVDEGSNHFFDIEPYKTYKDYFNVYAVVSMSDESGIGTVNTIVDNKFGTYFTQDRIWLPSAESCFAWAKKADANVDFTKALVINLMNTPTYEGVCMMYEDGSAIAFCPVSQDAYPYDFRGIIQHEAGGHGFGKLADEYIYHNAFIQNCACSCCDHPSSDYDESSIFGRLKALGWYKNVSVNADMHNVSWAHLVYHPNYSDRVDMYEGAYMHLRGAYRSEPTSCMNNNIPYYSAISRQEIVERIKECAGEAFDFDDFVAHDSWTVGTKASDGVFDWTFGVDPLWNRGSEEGSVRYMGEHPDYSKIN